MQYENIDLTEDTTRADCHQGLMTMQYAERGCLGDIIHAGLNDGRGLARLLCTARNSCRDRLASLD